MFASIKMPWHATRAIQQIEQDSSIAMACFNDDLPRGSSHGEKSIAIVGDWLEARFSNDKQYWER